MVCAVVCAVVCVVTCAVTCAAAGGSRLASREVLEPSSIIAKDYHATLHAGAGYIGFTPFFTRQADGIADGTWRDGRGIVGGVSYERAPADYAPACAEFEAKLTSLDDLTPFIGTLCHTAHTQRTRPPPP
jgi:hypothetical protein